MSKLRLGRRRQGSEISGPFASHNYSVELGHTDIPGRLANTGNTNVEYGQVCVFIAFLLSSRSTQGEVMALHPSSASS